jgi:ketopantoate hydroxymethyltransferase
MENRDHDLLGLNTDHYNMSKFVQLEDRNYMAISNAIKSFYEDIVKPRPPDCQVVYDSPNAMLE